MRLAMLSRTIKGGNEKSDPERWIDPLSNVDRGIANVQRRGERAHYASVKTSRLIRRNRRGQNVANAAGAHPTDSSQITAQPLACDL